MGSDPSHLWDSVKLNSLGFFVYYDRGYYKSICFSSYLEREKMALNALEVFGKGNLRY